MVSLIHDIFNSKLTGFDLEQARINSVVLLQYVQSQHDLSFNEIVGENEILHSNLLRSFRLTPSWEVLSTRFSFEGLENPIVPNQIELERRIIGVGKPASERSGNEATSEATNYRRDHFSTCSCCYSYANSHWLRSFSY